MVFVLALITYGLCALGLRKIFWGGEWVTLLILPTFFYCSGRCFLLLIADREWVTRLPIAVLYAVGNVCASAY